MPGVKEKVAKCEELKSQLLKTEQWWEMAKKRGEASIGNLDKASNISATLMHELGEFVDVHRKLVHQNQCLSKQVEEDLDKLQELLSVAKIHKLRSERRARNARDWLNSDEPEAATFLDRLTHDMMKASTMINEETFRLATTGLGMDFDYLLKMAREKRNDALTNLHEKLERESVVLVDAEWDAKEREEWQKMVDEEAEKGALCLDLEKQSLSPPSIPEPSLNLSLSKLEELSLDLSNLLIDEGKSLQGLCKDLSEKEVEPFNVE